MGKIMATSNSAHLRAAPAMATYIMFFTLNMLPLVHVQSMGTTTKN